MTVDELLDRLDGLDGDTLVVIDWPPLRAPGEFRRGHLVDMNPISNMDGVKDVVFAHEERAVILVRNMDGVHEG